MEAEEREARLDTPIFVCQLSFPGMPTLLHFFEPRYYLIYIPSIPPPDILSDIDSCSAGVSSHLIPALA
jgi:hypothetical protein